MSFSCGCCRTLGQMLFEYDTPRIVSIKSRKVGLINRLVQLGILAYVIGWVFVWQKGYQQFDSVISSVTTKVKGVAVTNTTDQGVKIWDVADYIIPPQEETSFFVMTNLIMTLNQQQGRCPEMPEDSPHCISDSNCTAGEQSSRSNGIQTGKCVPVKNRTAVHTCEVLAWCPLENDADLSHHPALLKDAEQFTVLIKNNIRYPKFNFTKRNILPHINGSYLKQCVFNRATDPDCPIFRLGDIVREAGEDFQEIAVEGGVMGIQIKWDCDLDQSVSKCVPQYTFRRLDNKDVQNTVAPGYNFRFAKYYKGPGEVESRTLIKAYGIRFDVMVFGKAGKFDIIPTMINIGSGLALLGVATVLCDVIVLHILKKKNFYREKKYKYVEDYDLVGNSPACETP
ncbi:P2X purinoceptor 4-like isoform X1 [Acipenser oxyrinchus oxyrinchus]|uniref:P2X purinoceptor n=1 Tax=Acipenser oxyrinchus oxyrinchus TaxID=40147 RepID=A0AAD8FWE9_ACIOX|nr:P2X purinoceptor 4-like isoform X1 [Acipenser oxyrinchus oxyrinchus]